MENGPENEYFREILRIRRVYLLEHLNIEDVLDYGYQEGVISHNEVESCCSHRIRGDKCKEFLNILRRNSWKEYRSFCSILYKIQPFVKDELDRTAQAISADGLVFISKAVLKENTDLLQKRLDSVLAGIGDAVLWLTDKDVIFCPSLSIKLLDSGNGVRSSIARHPGAFIPFNLENHVSPMYAEFRVQIAFDLDPKPVFGPPLFELGFFSEEKLQHVSWGISIVLCPLHNFNQCTQVWVDDRCVMCMMKSMPTFNSVSSVLNFGVVVDIRNGKLGFLDLKNRLVLGKFQVDWKNCLYHLLMQEAGPCDDARMSVTMVTGNDIDLSAEKNKVDPGSTSLKLYISKQLSFRGSQDCTYVLNCCQLVV